MAGTAVDAILVCFCSDIIHNEQTGKYAMSEKLYHFVKEKAPQYASDSVKFKRERNNKTGEVEYNRVEDPIKEAAELDCGAEVS